jgi:hypothetical protein
MQAQLDTYRKSVEAEANGIDPGERALAKSQAALVARGKASIS